jgi:uracil-DNA glycosylase
VTPGTPVAPGGAGLDALHAACRSCTACPELVAGRTQVVVGDVVPGARVVVVGEAPGAQEDLTGRPFVGRSGQLLDRLLAEAGLPREAVHVLNTVKCRPPGNRTPSRDETARCRPWLEQQLALLRPPVVVALGLSAIRWFLGPTSLAAVRGRAHEVVLPGGGVALVPTWHPSGALRRGPHGEPVQQLTADLRLAARLADRAGSGP